MFLSLLSISAGNGEVVSSDYSLLVRSILQISNIILPILILFIVILLIVLILKGIKALNIYIRKNQNTKED